jgi:ferredoxin
MATDVYHRLARHLDDLPGGFPPTESGVEQRILRRLFTPEEAELATHLTLLAEEPRVIARRAKIPPDEAAKRLEEMARKGLIYRVRPRGKPALYMAIQWVVGIWEFQVNRLSPELVHDFEEYLPAMFDPEAWREVPQIRTVPVGEAIPAQAEVLPYERAEAIVRAQKRLAVAPCICRQERALVGEGCGRPQETCLVFGMAADYYVENGLARSIDQEEALAILQLADEAGLVLQPDNAQKALNICCCCGCCCGVLRAAKMHPQPASVVFSPFVAVTDPETCEGCGICVDRCPMEALHLEDGYAVLNLDYCIGCGLCVTGCPSGSMSLQRRPGGEQRPVPRNVQEKAIRMGQLRGKMGPGDLLSLVVRSKVDRLLAGR